MADEILDAAALEGAAGQARGWRRYREDLYFVLGYVPLGVSPVVLMLAHGDHLDDAAGWLTLGLSAVAALGLLLTIYRLHRKNLQVQEQQLALYRLAVTDPLTGLGNRRALWLLLQHAEVSAEGRPAATMLLMFDLDQFKAVNDTLGHSVGDRLLVGFASALRQATRSGQDRLFRLGGDEFVAVLGDTQQEQGELVARRILALYATEAARISPEIVPSCSVGMGARVPGESSEVWLHRVDAAMYRAKDAGGGVMEAHLSPPSTQHRVERRTRVG